MDLRLPDRAVRDRVSNVFTLEPHAKREAALLDGPGCIRHIFLTTGANPVNRSASSTLVSRQTVIRVYFDDGDVPHIEAPVGDLFGVMHGQDWYPIDNHYLSVKAWNGYNCYFSMPFADSARIEFANGTEKLPVYLQVDWQRYPGQKLEEPRRFCARSRREMPTERYGDDFLILDADGPGELVGFVYGVRLIDEVDRWSHGGSDNIYIDGDGSEPAYLRGVGGEDVFGAGYGGALHPPETHHYAGLPYYVHEDVGEARVAQRLVGYRFFDADPISFERSLHLRFGCMANDICSTAYWYQTKPVRQFFELPRWNELLPGTQLPRGTHDLALPDSGSWWLCGPFGNENNHAMSETLPAESSDALSETYDGGHDQDSLWLTAASREAGLDVARWVHRDAVHGFVDFNHVFRPRARGAGITYPAAAVARCNLDASEDGVAQLRVAWDDELVLWVNQERFDLGFHRAFRSRTLEVSLRAGSNAIVLKLSNTLGSNHGGWAYAFQARTADGRSLLPHAARSSASEH